MGSPRQTKPKTARAGREKHLMRWAIKGHSVIDRTWYRHERGLPRRTSAGGVVVRLRGTCIEVALAREGDFPQYILPKGGVDPGETIEQAAQREIAEEAGLTQLTRLGKLGTRSRLTFTKRKWVTVHYYLYTTTAQAQQPTDIKHFHKAKWFPLSRLPEMLWPEQREMLESMRPVITERLRKYRSNAQL
ncbi:MAG: NUDIX domain-containing protein [Phycisphaeraceae bacterium]|nr:NUDIX domain-containing protein [Phycisphaeraceae bacterium]